MQNQSCLRTWIYLHWSGKILGIYIEQGGRKEFHDKKNTEYITQYCQYTVLKIDYQNGLCTHSKVFQTKEMMSLF